MGWRYHGSSSERVDNMLGMMVAGCSYMTEAGMISVDHQRRGLGKDGDGDGGQAGRLLSRYDVTEPYPDL
jgi:hypothetical protein